MWECSFERCRGLCALHGTRLAGTIALNMQDASILVILEPQAPTQPAMARAMMLARYPGAGLDVLYPAHTELPHSPLEACEMVAEDESYLTALRRSIAANDMDISMGIARGS